MAKSNCINKNTISSENISFGDDNFTKMYLTTLIKYFMNQGNNKDKVLACILKKMSYKKTQYFDPNHNIVKITQKEIADSLGVTRVTVTRVIDVLVKEDMIIKIGRGKIQVNPNLCSFRSSVKEEIMIEEYRKHQNVIYKKENKKIPELKKDPGIKDISHKNNIIKSIKEDIERYT